MIVDWELFPVQLEIFPVAISELCDNYYFISETDFEKFEKV